MSDIEFLKGYFNSLKDLLNNEKYLEESILSLHKQKYNNYEH